MPPCQRWTPHAGRHGSDAERENSMKISRRLLVPALRISTIFLSLAFLTGCTSGSSLVGSRSIGMDGATSIVDSSRTGQHVDASTSTDFIVRHPSGFWIVRVPSSRFWLREPDELPAPTPADAKYRGEPASSDDFTFSVRDEGSHYYGFPYLRVRIARPENASAPVTYVLGDVQDFQRSGYPVQLETLRNGPTMFRHYQRGPNEDVFVTARFGYVLIFSAYPGSDLTTVLADSAMIVRGFEVLP